MLPPVGNPSTDLPNSPSAKPTWSFHERYASDAEFKKQVDEARNRAAAERSTKALTTSLGMVANRQKLY